MTRLELVRHVPSNSDVSVWEPFAQDAQFDAFSWQDLADSWKQDETRSWWSVVDRGAEVARLELDQEGHYEQYRGLPDLDSRSREVRLFEVASSIRRSGIGRCTMCLLAQQFPGSRLLAFSEDADAFWGGLGWERFDHRNGSPPNRPLFVSPMGWETAVGSGA